MKNYVVRFVDGTQEIVAASRVGILKSSGAFVLRDIGGVPVAIYLGSRVASVIREGDTKPATASSGNDIHFHTHVSAMDSKDVIRQAPNIATAISQMITSGNYKIQKDIRDITDPQ